MSTSLATHRTHAQALTQPGRPTQTERQRRLELVTAPLRHGRPRTFYAVVTVATVAVIVVAQLLLSIAVSQGAYRIEALKTTQAAQQQRLQAATESLDELSSPQNLAANAHALGMVSTANPAFLRLSDGKILGAPEAGTTLDRVSGNLVANELLTDIPLVSGQTRTGVNAPKKAPAPKKAAAQVPGSPASNTAHNATSPVPFKGELPAPATH